MTDNEEKIVVGKCKITPSLDKLRERIEKRGKTLPFNISWVPVELFEKLDGFCKKNFHDDRVTFITFLWAFYNESQKFKSVDDKVDLFAINIQNALNKIEDRLEKLEGKKEEVREKKPSFSIRGN